MTHPQTKETLIRLAWLTELRRQGHRQCEGDMFNKGDVCALGLLAETAGLSRQKAISMTLGKGDKWGTFAPIGALAGLSPEQTDYVWMENDNRVTFAAIADVVEGWFK